ncbi:50S ribosomal protein L10 [Candidatus Aenigmatarchaeota archaeon]
MFKNEKIKETEKLKKLIDEYPVIGTLNMFGMPAKQLQEIRDNLRGTTVIRMSNKNLILRALKGSDKKLDNLLDSVTGEVALILSKDNPFKLFKIIKENRAPASAKAGQIAIADIPIKKGPTPVAPGPAISTFQKVGLKTGVEQGKISVMREKVIAKEGDTITEDMIAVFSLLKIEPMEVGLDITSIWENDVIYGKDVLDIDQDEYLRNLQLAVQQGIELSIGIGYITKDVAPLAIQKAFREAKAIAIDANIVTKDIVDELIMKAVREEKELESKLNIKVEEKNEEKPDEKKKEETPNEVNEVKDTKNEVSDKNEEKPSDAPADEKDASVNSDNKNDEKSSENDNQKSK